MFPSCSRLVRATIGIVAASLFTQVAAGQVHAHDGRREAIATVTEYRSLCQRDDGRLWGLSLCGPLLIVDPQTRTFGAYRDIGRDPTARDAIVSGTLPADVGVANTAIDWNGTRWTMVVLPLPDDPRKRAELLMHEAFHRIQPERLPPPTAPLPAHLDTREGRETMRLEWRALAEALRSHGAAQRVAIRDALSFRAARRRLGATAGEQALEINEGVAEYTGKRLGSADGVASTLATLDDYDRRDGYVRSFAYASGPAYGLLLDRWSPGWTHAVRPSDDLGELLYRATGDTPLPDPSSVRDRYGYADVHADEQRREAARDKQLAVWRERLVDGPTVWVPLQAMQIEFDPRNLVAMPGIGTVYPHAVLHDTWGTLTVTDGLLVADGGQSARVRGSASGKGQSYSGPGWQLALSPGWTLEDGRIRQR